MSEAKSSVASVPEEAAGERLDRFLARLYRLPRNQVQQWIRADRVRVDGRPAKASHCLVAGERIECAALPKRSNREMVPESGELRMLYEDPHLAVLDKPAGLAVHPGAGRATGTLAHRLLARYPETASVGGAGRPGIVHRIDKDTTGVLVVARTERAYQRLSAAFAERRVEKRYLGLVYGRPEARQGRIERPISRHPRRRQQMAVHPAGRPARTDFECLESASGISILELRLVTGRTHQLRVHLKALGHPLVGDPTYGEARWRGLPRRQQAPLERFERPALHAWRIAFAHPVSGHRLELEAPVPEDLIDLWREVTGKDFPV